MPGDIMTPEQLKRFDEARNHPYECGCEICKEWWAHVGPEDDPEDDPEDVDDSPYCECGNDPIEEEEATGHCFSCGKEL